MAAPSMGGLERTIFVAVDFGTTFSGIAWAAAARPDIQNSIIQWPDASSGIMEGVTSEKVPTEVVYGQDDFRWGFQIKDSEFRHQWFKLALDPESVLVESELVHQYPDKKALPPAYALSAEKICTDFMTALRKHTRDIISHKLSSSIVETTAFAFIVTVPALWKDGAKEKTRKCAREAGMGDNVMIISEPEAAAIHSLDMLDPHGLKLQEKFVVCDAGGGTVDLISYEIVELKPALKVQEATAGKGGVCGSSILNRIFQKHLEDRFGNMPSWDDEVLEQAMSRFEQSTKRNFGGSLAEDYVIPVNGLANNTAKGVRRGLYRMSGHSLRQIFAPVIAEIISLVQSQINCCVLQPKAILLVGGFGANSYLREQLKAAFPQLQVMQPANGWTAVARGALTKAIAEASPEICKVNINARVARRFYGYNCNVSYKTGIHDDWRKYWSNYNGEHRISVITWWVRKGDVIEESGPIMTDLYVDGLCIDGPIKTTTVRFFAFDDAIAPLYKTQQVKHLVTLTVNFSDILPSRYKTVAGADGEQYYQIDYKIKATFFSARTEYTLVFDGEDLGSVEAEYV